MGHRTFAARLAYVPDFDTAFATSVNMTCWVANGDGAHNFAVVQCVDLTGMTGNTGSDQGVRWKGHRLHLTICADVEGVGPGRTEPWVSAHHHVTVCFHFLSKHQDWIVNVRADMFRSDADRDPGLSEVLTVCRQKWT